jgi:ketosteroid isomerase-like protein
MTAVALCAAPALSQTPDASTKQLMVDWCKTYDATWNEKGPAADAPMFADNAIFTLGNGVVLRGRDAIQKVFSGIKPPTNHTCVIEEAHPMGTDALYTVGEVTVTGTMPSHIRFSKVVVKEGGGWKIQMLGATPILPPPPQ